MFQNLGQTIGSSIVKFRENKQKKEQEIAAENRSSYGCTTKNPNSPIFQSFFGIQNRDEAKAAAKDISKDPSLVNQAMMFAQNQMTMDANLRDKQKEEAEELVARAKLQPPRRAGPAYQIRTQANISVLPAGPWRQILITHLWQQHLLKELDREYRRNKH